jgi:hypothetical protein
MSNYIIILPWIPNGSKWHPTEPTGPFARLVRGSFNSSDLAHQWAARNLDGGMYEIHFECEGPDPEGDRVRELIGVYDRPITLSRQDVYDLLDSCEAEATRLEALAGNAPDHDSLRVNAIERKAKRFRALVDRLNDK